MEIRLDLIALNSPDYFQALNLREKILRLPLGLKFTPEDITNDSNEYHLGAFVETKLIGNVSLKPINSEIIKLKQMAIDPTYQGKGIGSKLLQYAEKYAIANNFKEIQLHARCHAQEFYAKFGYIPQGETFIEVGIPHILMRKKIFQVR